VYDAPAVQRPRFCAADQVLDVEQRLAAAPAQQRAVGAVTASHGSTTSCSFRGTQNTPICAVADLLELDPAAAPNGGPACVLAELCYYSA